MKPDLVIALDIPVSEEIAPVLDALPEETAWYKVGLELFSAAGPDCLKALKSRGKNIFLDLKLHDIPRTVSRAVDRLSCLGVSLITVHASGGRAMLEAAANAARRHGSSAPRIAAVTLLTSLDDNDLACMGISGKTEQHAMALARLAVEEGIDGVVCSAKETALFRSELGPDALIVTPGIRPSGSPAGDQKRVVTPAEAVRAGANLLVVGRPILQAENPRAAAERVLAEIASATADRGSK
ncbi:MAG: orotidine-5'-phosphate decarboxylase [Kiritimatiellia bacterium]